MTSEPAAGTPRPSTPTARTTWPAVLAELLAGRELSGTDAAWAMDEVMAGNATPAQLAAFAVLLRAKGETPAELAGLVEAMLAHAAPLAVDGLAVDVVGTGADRAHTVNISTMAALTVAGSGRRVVKHGNRAASSACGTADVLEELGVVIDLPPAGVLRTLGQVGIGFCFAPVFHAGMRHAGGPRRELGVPTAFNFLGPLTNPARVRAAAIGCADARMAPVMAAVLAARGDTAIVFRGDDGLDELTTTTTSSAWVAVDGEVEPAAVDPAALGIAPVEPAALRGGDRAFNARVVREVLAGRGGGVRDAVLLNAAAAIAAHDAHRGHDADGADGTDGTDGAATDAPLSAGRLHDALGRGLRVAADAIDSGAAGALLERWVTASRAAAGEQLRQR